MRAIRISMGRARKRRTALLGTHTAPIIIDINQFSVQIHILCTHEESKDAI